MKFHIVLTFLITATAVSAMSEVELIESRMVTKDEMKQPKKKDSKKKKNKEEQKIDMCFNTCQKKALTPEMLIEKV